MKFILGILVLCLVALVGPEAYAQATDATTSSAAWATALVPVAWIVLTGVVNTVAHYATPKDVDAWAERQPRVAQFFSILRRFGFEPVAGVTAIFGFFAGNPPPPGHAAAIGRKETNVVPLAVVAANDVAPSSGCAPSASSRGFSTVHGISLVVFVCALACGILRAAVPDATRTAVCEEQVYERNPGVTFSQFLALSITSCGGDAGMTIVDAIDALLQSKDPKLADFQREGRAVKADPEKLGEVRGRLGGHK